MGERDEDWLDKAEEERLGIIAKYDKGREVGAYIEPWDDPAFEIYHVTDHYGFIHDQRFPLKFNPEENKFRLLEAERADKWVKMHASWDKFKNSDKLRKRTFKGIPNKVRGLFWGLFLGLPTIKEQQKGKYEEMYNLARKHSLDVRQIDLDVNRTYRDNIIFRERYGVKQRSLFNILCAYSIYNSEVGYCQGMSQVAALLLLYMDEEDAFWGLSQLMSQHKYGMHGLFIAGFPKLVRFQQHHDKILKVMLPRLKKHFDKHGVDVGLYTLKWFFQCFLDRIPFELALRMWDIFLMDGDRVLICGAYTILKIHQKQLLARKSMDDILDYLQTSIPSNTNINNDKFMEGYQRCMEELQRKKLNTAGESTEEELPKKPFGLLENIIKPVPVRKEERKSVKLEASSIPVEVKEENKVENEEEEEEDISEKASASHVTVTSRASTNSPRNNSRPLSSISNFSYNSAIEEYHSSNKSTPLKMNGISSSTSKAGSSSAGSAAKKSPGDECEKLNNKIGNGSVESMEFIDNAFVPNAASKAVFSRDIESSSKMRNLEKIGTRVAPPPPARSLDSKHATTIAVVDSHNGDKSITSDLDGCSNVVSVKHHSRTSPISDNSGWSSPTVSIPSGETVRIHVPYSNSSNNSVNNPASSQRSNFDTLKNDPNCIKIDISSK